MMHSNHHSSATRHLSSNHGTVEPQRSTSVFVNNENENHPGMSAKSNNVEGFKTPSSKQQQGKGGGNGKSSQRRAFGDISNKKQGNANAGVGGTKGGGTTPVVRKLQLSTNTTSNNTHHNNNNKTKLSTTNVVSKSTSHAIKRSSINGGNNVKPRSKKQVNFVLPTDDPAKVDTLTNVSMTNMTDFDLEGLDPIEIPAGRTWKEQQLHNTEDSWEYLAETLPVLPDLGERLFAQRRRAREERQTQLEQEGEEILQRRFQELAVQDELDDRRFAQEMMATNWLGNDDDESLDMALDTSSSIDFLDDVSF